ncbi:hypothetical protein JCM15457_860 [Liquorilactobacillus sucicola DSM 21376 = JCM 15457]|uniref:Uncharacterized protein n=1 Tax=Liquorilactobacillus sucicola DSM 21376 = JCM 15457 TaxID=1423806 RepID=A0A023CVR5_9LACO|nr:hypothetical protein FD15_GL001217 [Liquorilactobacillus sucicola DSM 21376 = JCM 15457]GAJ25957.1 hypothetical protein JCM15457_860 [Liquorilactobacillus sucicola DSM 21376 = JCM 15457]
MPPKFNVPHCNGIVSTKINTGIKKIRITVNLFGKFMFHSPLFHAALQQFT